MGILLCCTPACVLPPLLGLNFYDYPQPYYQRDRNAVIALVTSNSTSTLTGSPAPTHIGVLFQCTFRHTTSTAGPSETAVTEMGHFQRLSTAQHVKIRI
jgi:hypothetical protein